MATKFQSTARQEMRNMSLQGEPAASAQPKLGWALTGPQQMLSYGFLSIFHTDAYLPGSVASGTNTPNPNFKNLGYYGCAAVIPSFGQGVDKASAAGGGGGAPAHTVIADGKGVHVANAHTVDVVVGGATRFKRGNGSSTQLEPVPVAEERCRRAVERAIRKGYDAVRCGVK